MIDVNPSDPLLIRIEDMIDLVMDVAVIGVGVVRLYGDWLRPHLASGALRPVLEAWWRSFPGPYLYCPGRQLVPTPLKTFINFVKAGSDQARFQP